MLARPDNGSIDIGNRHEQAARLLVLGAERVGKSAAIVRFTTGRFIHQYCPSTQDWLYKHQLCQDGTGSHDDQENSPPPAPAIQIELLEQKDTRQGSGETSEHQQQSSLALRAASDQRADRELRECQQLLDKLQWANAYVIVYSLIDPDSFDKAREYLDLLDWMHSDRTWSNNQTNQQSIRHKIEQRRLTSGCRQGQQRRPVLLLGNKHDLARSCPSRRQVTLEQGHELAVQHKCLFAELSISECANSIRSVLFELIGRVLPAPPSHAPDLQHSHATSRSTQLVQWRANPKLWTSASSKQQQQPAWSSLIKTQMPLVSSSHSTRVDSRLHEEPTTNHQQPVAATFKPLVTSSYSNPRPVAVGQCTAVAQPSNQRSTPSKQSNSPTSASRYGALKSTFKKASLAIVGGKALASRASTGRHSTGNAPQPPPLPVTALKRNSTTSSNLSELVSEHSFSVRDSIGSLSSNSTTAAGGNTANEQVAPPSKLNKSSNWIKSRFVRQESSGSEGKMGQGAIAIASSTCELQQPPQQQPEEQVAGGKFKRPLFKYKNRLRTVGFEPSFSSNRTTGPTKRSSESIQTITTSSLDGATGSQQQQPQQRQTIASGTTSPLSSSLSSSSRSSAPNAPSTYNANRCSSGRSSSSLSASDTYYSSLFVVCQAANSPGGPAAAQPPAQPPGEQWPASVSPCRHAPAGAASSQQDSRSTLSRASTSLGSYDEMLEDMESAASECAAAPPPPPAPPAQPTSVPSRKISADSKPPVCGAASSKTRFQVVKSVHSTLTNLAKSTRATVTPAHPVAKRSFCSALMSSSMSLAGPQVVCESSAAALAPIQQVAKIEAIRAIPAVLGYCK